MKIILDFPEEFPKNSETIIEILITIRKALGKELNSVDIDGDVISDRDDLINFLQENVYGS